MVVVGDFVIEEAMTELVNKLPVDRKSQVPYLPCSLQKKQAFA